MCALFKNEMLKKYYRLKVRCSSKFNSIGNIITVDDPRNKRNSVAEKLSDSSLFSRNARTKRNIVNESLDVAEASNVSVTCNTLKIPLSTSDGNSFSTNVWIDCFNFLILLNEDSAIVVHSKHKTFRRRRHVQPLFPSLFQRRGWT